MKIYLKKLRSVSLLLIALLASLALGAAILGVLGVSTAPQPLAAQEECDRYVSLGRDDVGDCSDQYHPCGTIQYAIRQAAPGARVCVATYYPPAPRTYTGSLEITKSLVLDGAWMFQCIDPHGLQCKFTSIPCDPANIILDAQGAGRVISISGGIGGNGVITLTIDCFTITGGDAVGLGGVKKPNEDFEHDAGGGIFSRDAAPIIMNNVITGNFGGKSTPTYGHGGGVCLVNAPATALIYNNLIAYNVGDGSTTGAAGGVLLFNSDAEVVSNTIRNNRAANSAGRGGGIAVRGGRPSLAGNTIISNAGSSGIEAQGGGIYINSSGPVTLTRNRIHNNEALSNAGGNSWTARGGGVYAGGDAGGVVVMKFNQIYNNIAAPLSPHQGNGGGVYLYNLVIPSGLYGNEIHDNVAGFNDSGAGGGVYLKNSVTLMEDNAIFNNAASWSGNLGTGGGLFVDGGQLRLADNTITDNHAVAFTGPPNTDTVGLGGGVYVTHTTAFSASGNTLTGNTSAGDGGGMYVISSANISLASEDFSHNFAAGDGGAMYAVTSSLTLAGLNVYSNTAESGGGLYLKNGSNTMLSNTLFSQNLATNAGGGMFIFGGSALTLTQNLWLSNTALYGGGLYVQTASGVTVRNSAFIRNVADGVAGAYCLFNKGVRFEANTIYHNAGDGVGVFADPDARLDNNVIAGNDEGVSVFAATAHLRHNTIVSNRIGVSVYSWLSVAGMAAMTNSIVAGNTTGITTTEGETATLTATLWGEGAWRNGQDYAGAGTVDIGTDNLYVDPAFVAPGAGDYHLRYASPAIAAGVETPLDQDMDGAARSIGVAPDLGADESVWRPCFLPLVLRQL